MFFLACIALRDLDVRAFVIYLLGKLLGGCRAALPLLLSLHGHRLKTPRRHFCIKDLPRKVAMVRAKGTLDFAKGVS